MSRSGLVDSKPDLVFSTWPIRLADVTIYVLLNVLTVITFPDVFASLSLAYSIRSLLKVQPLTIVPSSNTCSPKRSIWFCSMVCS